MAWVTPRVWAVSEVVTAAKMNEISSALLDLDRRTSPVSDFNSASASTTSTTFADLSGSTGPAVSLGSPGIGSTGKAWVTLSCKALNTVAGGVSYMSVALSGATTQAANFDDAAGATSGAANAVYYIGVAMLLSGLTAGATTFTAKYATSAAGTCTAERRRVAVTPLGS